MSGQRTCHIRLATIEPGHPQPQTIMLVYKDNYAARFVLTASMRQKLSKAFDMRFYLMRNHTRQIQFNLIWRKGKLNMAD